MFEMSCVSDALGSCGMKSVVISTMRRFAG